MGSRLCEATCEATCSRCQHCTGAPSPDGKHPTAPPSHPPHPPSHPQGALRGLNRQARFVTLCTILGELGGETQVHRHLRQLLLLPFHPAMFSRLPFAMRSYSNSFVHGRQIFVRHQGPISGPQTRPNFQGHLDGPLPCDVPWWCQLNTVNCARLRARVRRFKMCTPRQHWTQSSIRVQARFLGRSPVGACLHLPNAASSNDTFTKPFLKFGSEMDPWPTS